MKETTTRVRVRGVRVRQNFRRIGQCLSKAVTELSIRRPPPTGTGDTEMRMQRAMSYECQSDVGQQRIYAWLREITIWPQTQVSESEAYLESRFPERTSFRGPEIPGDTLSG